MNSRDDTGDMKQARSSINTRAVYQAATRGEIGERIKERRKVCGYTQERLATLLFTSRETVNQWERGARDLKTGDIIQLANMLQTSCDYLLTGIDTPNINFCEETSLSNRVYENLKKSWSRAGETEKFLNALLEDGMLKYLAHDYCMYTNAREKYLEFASIGVDEDHGVDFWLAHNIRIETFHAMSFDAPMIDTGEIIPESVCQVRSLLADDVRYQLFKCLETVKEMMKGDSREWEEG